MFKEVLTFELQYRKARTTTYVYFGVIFLLCFLTVLSPVLKIAGADGQTKANAPFVITYLTILFSFYFTLITSAVMGVAIVRDFEQNTEAILFSTPMKKFDYLMGRFAGSFLVLTLINTAVILGFMSGFAVGKFVPWEVAWKAREILPFSWWNYLQPFLMFTMTNLFTIGALFFMSGALGRSAIVIYTQGIVLVVLYAIGNSFLRDLDSQQMASLIDPFGLHTFLSATRYWTPTEQNTQLLTLDGMVLYNRLIWAAVGLGALLTTYFAFSFNVVRSAPGKKKVKASANTEGHTFHPLRQVGQKFDVLNNFQQLASLSIMHFKMIWKEIPFLAIVASGVLLLFVSAMKVESVYGTGSYLTTNNMLTMINGTFGLFFLIIITFYSGELVWKERSARFHLILDATPMSSFVSLLGKLIALLLAIAAIILILITFGVVTQSLYGYYTFELPVYFKTLYAQTFINCCLLAALAFFVQVLVNNKFLGFAVCIVFVIVNAVLGQLGFEHDMWQYASGSLGIFSDMNAYGHFVPPFAWLKIYWGAFATLLLSLAVIFTLRGTDKTLRMRWRTGKERINKALVITGLVTGSLFLFSGTYIYYNTAILNKFETTNEHQKTLAEYEREIGKYESVNQPKITAISLKVELYPYLRDFAAQGYYYLKNESAVAISDIHVQQSIDPHLIVTSLDFDRAFKVKKSHESVRHTIYELDDPLQPQDSLKMNFRIAYITEGFEEDKSSSKIIYNGTYFDNSHLPSLGYNSLLELTDRDTRLAHGLGEKKRLPTPAEEEKRKFNLTGDDADRIRFDVQISTEHDQTAIAPGYLQKEWHEGNRRYFHYKAYAPISNLYSIASARYAIKRDRWNDVDLEIYYHPGHEYNLEQMMKGMKDGLNYFSEHFGPFQYRQLRIVEFPRYTMFARSFANTIPFSEGVGFILKVNDPAKDLDMAYYTTAHELAHQWWGHQVMEANVQGGSMLSEGLAQYSSLMVMKASHTPEMIERYLRYELNNYLRGRASERRSEQPLQFVEQQSYIYSNKASLVFYALQDYLGEDSLNAAIRRYRNEWVNQPPPYPTSVELLKHIRQSTPDTLQYLIHDLFETITLFENKAEEVMYDEQLDGGFEVIVKVMCEKIRIDSTGVEKMIPLNDWIDIGVYAEDSQGKEKLVYLKKHLITRKENTFTIPMRSKPIRAGIDPLHKLIDKHANDNTLHARKFIEIGNIPVQ